MKMTKRLMVLTEVIFLLVLVGCVTVEIPQGPPTGAAIQEAVMKDGVQVATLSWGTLNYKPEVIKLKKDIPARIEGDMQRLTGCYRVFEIPDLKIEKRFSEKNSVIEFTPTKEGTFAFGCAMGMGGGTLVVE